MKLVDGGELWKLHATHGIPIEIGLIVAQQRGFIPTWDRIVTEAEKDGTNIPRFKRRLLSACRDVYPPDVCSRLERFLWPG